MNSIYINRALRALFVAFCIIIGYFTVYLLIKYAYPFLIALFIALLINPFVNFLERKVRLPRALAVIISIVLIIGAFVGLITLLVAEIVSGANYLADVLPEHVQTLVNYSESLVTAQVLPFYEHLSSLFKNLDAGQQDTIVQNIQSAGQKIASTAGDFLSGLFTKLPALVSWIPNAATVLIFALLSTFFISKDWYGLTSRGKKLLPKTARKSSSAVFSDLRSALFGFIRAELTLISMTLVIVLIGLLILRVDYAITIALVCGIVDILPYLGTGLVFVPWVVYEFISGDIPLAIGLSVLYLVVVVQRQVMEPKILSSSIGLDPLATLIALFVGYKTVGFLGLILGPITLVLLTTLIRTHIFQDIWDYIMVKKPLK
ncbi:sporulation integral membrane protein YtvI [Heyndrickxia acidiproducens]|uniref:sporulation integral membrane protein YtvI n=1 Tax=Heyndrickxia acidiproducens TaxID=1121084 RepID=UPI000361CD78|nr:sporulation integral membrane protein YtvI [Heyndrickxia acidiproducens]